MPLQALQVKNQDEVITQISKAYDQFALVIESKKFLDESKNVSMPIKTAEKVFRLWFNHPFMITKK